MKSFSRWIVFPCVAGLEVKGPVIFFRLRTRLRVAKVILILFRKCKQHVILLDYAIKIVMFYRGWVM